MRAFCRDELEALSAVDRLRQLRVTQPTGPARALVDGRPVVVFCSNDYLGLASDPELARAAADGARRWGAGAGASRLITGTLPVHVEAEEKLARFMGTEGAVLFPSGYHANLGVFSAFVREGDVVHSDALNHASLIDGCRLSRASVRVYPHCDVAALDRALAESPKSGRSWVVSETLFSMDGDAPDLCALAAVAQRHGAFLVADEAHSLGAVGPQGRGSCAELGVTPDLCIGTLGKAFGCSGAFVGGAREATELLANRARSFVFTTAVPPAVAAAVSRAVELVEAAEDRRAHLRVLEARARRALRDIGFPTPSVRGPILPIVLGDEARTMAASEALLQLGYFVQGIRPPTVPVGSSRLRLTLSAAHSPGDIDGLCAALASVLGATR
jgi:8-amino-7-oxononanoate synthase